MTSVKLLDRYLVEKEIGRGASGSVYMGSYIKDESVKVAVKKIKFTKNKASTVQFLKSVKNEIEILKKVDSPYIIKFFDYHVTPENIYIVSEFCEGEELLNVILREGRLSEMDARNLFRQVLYGIMHCHSMGVIHRDIKAENLVFKDTLQTELRIIDFGLGNQGIDVAKGVVGTPYYMAPEIFTKPYYDKRYDIWSMGVLLYVMLTGMPPFPGSDMKKIVQKIIKNPLNFEQDVFKNISDNAKDLISQLLMKNPDERITLQEVCTHQWMTEEKLSTSIDSKIDFVKTVSDYRQMNLFTKAVKMCMSKMYECTSFTNLKNKFLELDKDKNGVLSISEFKKVIEMIGLDEKDVDIIISALDLDRNGEIEYSEFISACANFDKVNMMVAAEMMFGLIDKDNSGQMDFTEFTNFFVNQNIQYDTNELKRIFDDMDENGDKIVDMYEFSKKFKTYFAI